MTGDSARREPTGLRAKGRPKLEDAAQIERAIREATIATLLEQGEAATLNAVAQAAGISRKSLYARYSSKSELFIAVIRGLLSSPEWIAIDTVGTGPERLFNYIKTALRLILTDQSKAMQRLLTVEPAYIGALKNEMRAATDRHLVYPLRDLLRDCTARGEFTVADPEATARAIMHMVFAEGLSPHADSPSDCDGGWQDQSARFLADLVAYGLVPRAPRPG